jgi:hypothetical protein
MIEPAVGRRWHEVLLLNLILLVIVFPIVIYPLVLLFLGVAVGKLSPLKPGPASGGLD